MSLELNRNGTPPTAIHDRLNGRLAKGSDYRPAPASAFPEEVTLAESDRLTFSLCLLAPTIIFGLGTTGTSISNRLAHLIRACFGRLPDHIQVLNYDATADESDEKNGSFTGAGRGGAGSVMANGVELFEAQRPVLRSVLRRKTARLRQAESEFQPHYHINEALDVNIIGGFGGSSSGAWNSAIDLVHEVAGEMELHGGLCVHAVMIDPEMALRDIGRKVERLQAQNVRANAGVLVEKFLSDFVSEQILTENKDCPFPIAVASAQRLRTIRWFGRGNGSYQFDRIDDLCSMAAHALFMLIATQAGKYFDDRLPDLEVTGDTGRFQEK